MKIREIFLPEAYIDELNSAIMNIIAIIKSNDRSEIPTKEFRRMLSREGYVLGRRELVTVLNDLDVIGSADRENISLSDASDQASDEIPDEEDFDDQLPDLDELPDVSDQEFDSDEDSYQPAQDMPASGDTSGSIVKNLATKQAVKSIR